MSIAIAAALTGPDATLGENIKAGVTMAVEKHNAPNPGCQVGLKPFDTEGDAQKATTIAPQIIDDTHTVGLVGPGNSGETKATGDVFAQAGLVTATPSATNVTLSANGWRTFFRGLANDAMQGPSVAHYLTKAVGSRRVCVVDDSSDYYGLGLARAVRQALGPLAQPACDVEVKRGGDNDFSAAATQLQISKPDAILYGGYYTEVATLVAQLRNADVSATFAAGDATNDVQFVKLAGDASAGAILSCPCAPAAGAFADAYAKRFDRQPGTYSAESYDLATIMLNGIDAGHVTRPAMLDFVRAYHGQGVARSYQWSSTGELTTDLIWIYKVEQ